MNPLLARLLKHKPRFHNLSQITLVLAPWLVVFSCGLLLSVMARFSVAFQLWSLLAISTVGMAIFVPFFAASFTTTLVTKDLRNFGELLLITPLAPRQIVLSYFYAVLWQLRSFFALLAILGLTTISGLLRLAFITQMDINMFLWGTLWTMLAIEMAGVCLAVVAMSLALSLRAPYHSLVFPLVALVLLMIEQAITFYLYLHVEDTEQVTITVGGLALFLLVFPYILTVTFLVLAQWWLLSPMMSELA